MGATKEMVITKFDYKNDEGFYTMFEYENQMAIEYNGYDVSLIASEHLQRCERKPKSPNVFSRNVVNGVRRFVTLYKCAGRARNQLFH